MNIQSHSDISKPKVHGRIAFLQSCWHREIVDNLRDSFLTEITQLNHDAVDFFEVPGAFELPLQAKILADSGRYAGIVVAGLVVDGGIYRHEFVAAAVIDGLMRVQLNSTTPVFSAVLTPHDFLTEGQPEFFAEHFVEKGVEVARACQETLVAHSRFQALNNKSQVEAAIN
ncbi:6,7-dimethyl-8-ribityllumazine synthase [Porticoccaceae bacterium]|nr:6,7-dimethyl-8-ribityllumazine synthase [Porticoccaceae bacterium]